MNKENYQKLLESELSKDGAAGKELMLHACCAPCSSHVLDYLHDKIKITVFYYNPNIVEKDEYYKREAELERLIEEINKEYPGANINFAAGNFEPERFLEISKGLEKEPEGGARCEKCFYLRLKETAIMAKESGSDYFTTTLTISPLKNAELLNNIGREISREVGIPFLPSDFKKKEGYKHSVELSAKYGLYRQNYCGCPFSKAESLEREKANKERK